MRALTAAAIAALVLTVGASAGTERQDAFDELPPGRSQRRRGSRPGTRSSRSRPRPSTSRTCMSGSSTQPRALAEQLRPGLATAGVERGRQDVDVPPPPQREVPQRRAAHRGCGRGVDRAAAKRAARRSIPGAAEEVRPRRPDGRDQPLLCGPRRARRVLAVRRLDRLSQGAQAAAANPSVPRGGRGMRHGPLQHRVRYPGSRSSSRPTATTGAAGAPTSTTTSPSRSRPRP